MALIAKLEGYLKTSSDPDQVRQSIARARADLAKVEADLISARAAEADASQRSAAAGNLHSSCQRMVDNRGRLA
ncbi:hypothetical protein [Mesorhizobium huakuii]|uniref:Uncharacterized protein n=1 Tax=Mesorhizobium huakuii TaxID=28104 RepID=A0A7G6SUP3_9HYPH|nr:hypothetical protein [Mesorhizobium huakuii]QND58225.1 hypothetical protein HB778_17725 [Mesorhizobium huakuii]